MTIKVKDGRFFSRWYFAGAAGAPFDVMAAVWKDCDADHWEASYRFRYYKDEKVLGSADEKRWYAIRFPKTMSETDVLRSFGGILSTASQAAGLELSIVTVQSDSAKKVVAILDRELCVESLVEKAG